MDEMITRVLLEDSYGKVFPLYVSGEQELADACEKLQARVVSRMPSSIWEMQVEQMAALAFGFKK
jgi:hypothetical protein